MPHRVVVHGKTVDVPAPGVLLIGLHDGFSPIGPSGSVAARTHGDLQHLLLALLRGIEVPDEAAVNLHLAHDSSRASCCRRSPSFRYRCRARATLYGAGCPLAARSFASVVGCCGGHVFQPLGRLLGSTGADIDRDVSLGTDLVEEVHEFVLFQTCSARSRRPSWDLGSRLAAGRSPCASGIHRQSSHRASERWAPLSLSSAPTTSLRIPRVFGILESGPTQMPS